MKKNIISFNEGKIRKALRLEGQSQRMFAVYIAASALIVVLGGAFLINIRVNNNLSRGYAQGPYASFEPETAAASGSLAVGNDATASGGKYVQFGYTAPPPTCAGVSLAAGADIQAAINANAAGTMFCLSAGTYRVATPLAPKSNQQFVGVAGQSVINASKVVSGFTASGATYVATGFLPGTANNYGECTTPGCDYNQSVFWDDQPLTRVMSAAAVTSGKYYEDYAANKIYVGANPAGHTVEQAVSSAIMTSTTASGVVIKNMILEKAANLAQNGAIMATGSATGWNVDTNEIRFNHGVGIVADASTMKNNHVHHNGQMGMGGHGTGGVASGNEIDHNNTAGFNILWEAGGTKFVLANNWDITGNTVHDNNGPGLWCDINCNGVIFENNTVFNNITGIVYEISYNCTIRGNNSYNNGATAGNGFYDSTNILISASPGCEVYNNTVSGNNGIGILQQNRSGDPVTIGPHETHDTYVHDNTITVNQASGFAAGLSQDVLDQTYFTSRNNRFVHNTYHLPNQTGYWFTWMDGARTKANWLAYGQDTTGTYLTP